MNVVTLIGNLGRDPELKYTPSGKAVVNFSLAVARGGKANEDGTRETDWINCVAWEQRAEFVANYCTRGDKLAVLGEWRNSSWVTEGGQKRTVAECLVSRTEKLTPRKNSESEGGGTESAGGGVAPAGEEYDPFAEEG